MRKIKKVVLFSENEIKKVKKLRYDQNYSQAEESIIKLLNKQPDNYYAQAEYAQLAHELGKYELSTQQWELLLNNKRIPENEKIKFILRAAESFLEANQKEKALNLLLSYHSFLPEAYLGLANCYLPDQNAWLDAINQFFSQFSVNKVESLEHATSFYTSLSGKPEKSFQKSPKVSVIMSAFNAEKHLEFAANSILAQSWKNLELIIVNDASVDKTQEIAHKLENQDQRVKVIDNKINMGTYVSRNLALDMSSGDFVTTQDSDDWAHPDRLLYQVDNLLKNDYIANLTKSVRLSDDGKFELTSWGSYLSDRCCASFMMKKDQAFPLFGYWDSVRVSGDVEYIERVYAVLGKKSIGILPEPLVFQLRHINSLTTAPLTMGVAGRVSQSREIYKSNYQAWHNQLRIENCYISSPLVHRPFFAPLEIVVPTPGLVLYPQNQEEND